jgi:peptide/nickel transport system permease protein
LIAYISRRLGALLVILFGSSFLLYNLESLSGDPTESLRLSLDPKAKYQLLQLVNQLDLNTPAPLRYFKWLRGILGGLTGHLNFGMTRDMHTVTSELAGAIPTTIRLVTTSALVALVLGLMLGIATALRQYSRFDYAVTFFSFLMFSLPIFWVAVLLKEFLAIKFNNFLAHPNISFTWIIILSIISALFWSGIIARESKRFLQIFGGVFALNVAFLELLNAIHWIENPRLGPVVILLGSVGIAYGVTALSTGIENRAALKASLTMAVITTVLYYPIDWIFKKHSSGIVIFILAVLTIGTAVLVGLALAKIDRRPVIRTTIISSLLMGFLILLDRLMQAWRLYLSQDGVYGRPIPTIGQSNPLLSSTDYWVNTMDRVTHIILPTVALTLISFAGYVRFSRGTMLEVLNQDYIRTARAKGLNERTVIMRHAFRNTLIPISTIVVVDLAGIIGGAIITERVFGWHGMGTLFNQAITSFDLHLLMGVFAVTATLSVLANLVADLLYTALDPRIRVGGGK